jgi:hypothetical protein
MALANFNLDELREKVVAAYRADDPLLQKFRGFARELRADIRPLRAYSVNAISFVSADGGDNRLVLNPVAVELIRIVDSRGNQCALDAIASTASLEELELRATSGNLSYLIKGLGQPGKATGALRCYRDIVEWCVLYDLITNPSLQWGGDTIFIRDGLLRTKSFKREVFPQIDQRLRAGIAAHARRNVRISLVGVAKQSAVLGRLAVALELEGTFHKPFPCYVRVPSKIEAECYNFDRTWLDTYETSAPDDTGRQLYQSLGSLFLAKFGDSAMDPIWPVDVAEWQVGEVDRVLGQLMVDAQQGFPMRDYPMTIQRAHDFAKLSGLEIEVLQDLLLQGMCQSLGDNEAERLLRLKHLGRSLAGLRYKEA